MVGVGSALLEGGRSKLLLLLLCLCQRYHDSPDLIIEQGRRIFFCWCDVGFCVFASKRKGKGMEEMG